MLRNLPVTRSARVLPFLSFGLSLGLLALATACSSGGGSGGGGTATVQSEVEPNATTAQALPIQLDRTAIGTVETAGDLDLWRLDLANGEVVRIELRGVRHDQDVWDLANNLPRLTVFAADGVTKLLEHDYSGNFSDGWGWGAHDLDVPMFRAPADGAYYVQVTQDDTLVAGGDYSIKASLVDLGTTQVEAEPTAVSGLNDTTATAEAITPGWVRGFHVDDESDFYSFTITGPTVVAFEMVSYRNGVFAADDAYFDTALELYATDGITTFQTNDDAYFYDSALHYALTTPGTYYVNVMECCGAGDAGYFLRFSASSLTGATAETEANDTSGTANATAYGAFVTGAMDVGETDFFSFAGTAGDCVHLEFWDASHGEGYFDDVDVQLLDTDGATTLPNDSGGIFQTTRAILTTTGTFFVRVTPDGSPLATNYAFRVKRFHSGDFEAEPNDTAVTAETFPVSNRTSGTIDPALDVDTFSFTATANTLVSFTLHASSGIESDGIDDLSGNGSTLDPLVVIRNSIGDIVAKCGGNTVNLSAESVTDALATMAVSFVPAAAGTYTIEVTDTGATGATTHTYVLIRD